LNLQSSDYKAGVLTSRTPRLDPHPHATPTPTIHPPLSLTNYESKLRYGGETNVELSFINMLFCIHFVLYILVPCNRYYVPCIYFVLTSILCKQRM